jgi:hypothetical protein
LPQVTSSSPSFEEVALRLMETGEPEAVAAFLQTRLDTLGREDKAQASFVVWAVAVAAAALPTCCAASARSLHACAAAPAPLTASGGPYSVR